MLFLSKGSIANAFGDSDEYREYKRGCLGLCNVRLGLPYMDFPFNSAEAGFKDFDSAMKYAQGLAAKPGKKIRIFAALFDKCQIDESKWDQMSGEIPDFKHIVAAEGLFDFRYCPSIVLIP